MFSGKPCKLKKTFHELKALTLDNLKKVNDDLCEYEKRRFNGKKIDTQPS